MVLEQYIQNPYLRAVSILVLVFVALKLLVFIIEKIILRFTRKTKTDLDDRIVEKSSKPLTVILFLIGLRLALIEIPLLANIEGAIASLVYSIIIILVGYIAYVIIDLVIYAAWRKVAIKTKSSIDEGLVSLIHSILKATWIILVFL